jgi:Uma2 family endonuclease
MAAATTLTGAEFDALYANDERRLELIEGEVVEVSSATLLHQTVVRNLLRALLPYFASRPDVGDAWTDVEFALDDNWRVRPDIFVLFAGRTESINGKKVPIPGAPDMAIEVISSSEHAADVLNKVQAYLRAGTQEAWQVYPAQRTILVHTNTGICRYTDDARLTTPLLPGFDLELNRIF